MKKTASKQVPDYRGRTYVQPDGSVPKKGPTPAAKRKGRRK